MKISPLLILFSASIFFFSCSKDAVQCEICENEITGTYVGDGILYFLSPPDTFAYENLETISIDVSVNKCKMILNDNKDHPYEMSNCLTTTYEPDWDVQYSSGGSYEFYNDTLHIISYVGFGLLDQSEYWLIKQ